ncbi:ABC transporter permease [Rufibacter radiotolerans]|nr:ABC transporter permease [Rufibacter radiotolerans]
MQDADVATYGLPDAATQSSITADYQKRTGLHLPLFYVGMVLQGRQQATHIKALPADRPWVEQAVLWKGVNAAIAFYTAWQAWLPSVPEKNRQEVFKELQTWVNSERLENRENQEQKVLNLLSSSPCPQGYTITNAWKNLQAAEAPLHYYLPQLNWNGAENAYYLWLKKLLKGDLGASNQDYEPVINKIGDAALISFAIAILGLVVGLITTYFAGLYFTLHPHSTFTKTSHLILYFLDSIPGFLIALGLYGLALYLAGYSSGNIFGENQGDESLLQLWTQPSILLGGLCIVLLILPHITLQFHRSLKDQMNKLYLKTALAKGLTYKKAIQVHALPNAMVASFTILSEVIIGLMAGVLIIETTFSLPGLGSLLTKSILSADFPVLIGLTLFFLLFRVVVIWVMDNLLALIDPRMNISQNA